MGDVSATTLLFDRQRKPFSVPTLNQRSDVNLRSAPARSTLRHRPIRFCFFEFAAPISRANRIRWPFAGSVPADAFVPGALCYERNSGRDSCNSSALSLFASAEEREAARITICVARIGDGRGNVSKSDRNSVAADLNCCNCSQARCHAGVSRDLVAQYRSAARDLFRGMRVALRTHLAEVRHTAARQLGCSQRVRVVAGPRLSHDG